jgi:hypothetical protein
VETSGARPFRKTVGTSGTPLAGPRLYEERDRPDALEILRRRLRQGDVPYSMHPGEWNWWVDHADPRLLVTEPVAPVTGVDMISQHDPGSERVLADAGFEPDETQAEFASAQPLTGGLPDVVLPAGYVVRSMTDADARSRADAARLSFRSISLALVRPGPRREVPVAALSSTSSRRQR